MRRILLAMALPLILLACDGSQATAEPQSANNGFRIATFNIAMGMEEVGQLNDALAQNQDPRLLQLAEILQRVRPDIILLSEFDYDPGIRSASLLNQNYLATGQNGQLPIQYPFSFRAESNTGLDSGYDLDGDGQLGEPEDAFGFGHFPGQYGMLVLSRFPIRLEKSRFFQTFLWADMPGARRPLNPDGSQYYPDEVWSQLRLSSKSHWDLVFKIKQREFHLLAYHPTPPVFDGADDHNGLRNFDESRFWVEYIESTSSGILVDDEGQAGGLASGAMFVIAGDLNADPQDGDSVKNAVGQLLDSPAINSSCIPVSNGALEASGAQAGINQQHLGDPAADTSDFNDQYVGNLRLDYLMPAQGLTIQGCGVFWPAPGEEGHSLVDVSDHRLVWLDIQ